MAVTVNAFASFAVLLLLQLEAKITKNWCVFAAIMDFGGHYGLRVSSM